MHEYVISSSNNQYYSVLYQLVMFHLLLEWDPLKHDRYSLSSGHLCSCYDSHLLVQLPPLGYHRHSPAYLGFCHCFQHLLLVPLACDKCCHSLAYLDSHPLVLDPLRHGKCSPFLAYLAVLTWAVIAHTASHV